MNTNMDDSRIDSIAQLEEFVNSSQRFVLQLKTIEDRYAFIDRTVDRFSYKKLSHKQKHTIYLYLRKLTGYKKAQLLRLIKRAVLGKLTRKKYKRINPNRIYTATDIKLLEKTDEFHLRLNAIATHEILKREYEVFNHKEYENLAHRLAQELLSSDEPIPDFSTRFPNILESCLARPFQKFHKKDIYKGLIGKAAILFYLMIKNHPFQNGNKRIATTALFVLLYKNKKWLKVDDQELYNFAVWVTQSPAKLKEEAVKGIEKFIKIFR